MPDNWKDIVGKKTSDTKQYDQFDSFDAEWSIPYKTVKKTSHKQSKKNKNKRAGEKL
jgi:hypothetical protein